MRSLSGAGAAEFGGDALRRSHAWSEVFELALVGGLRVPVPSAASHWTRTCNHAPVTMTLMNLLRASPALLVGVLLLVGALGVCLLLGWRLAAAGASVRPIVWFGGFFLLVVLPLFLGSLHQARETLRSEAPRIGALSEVLEAQDPTARQAAARRLFGPDADASLVRDARDLAGEVLTGAQIARFATVPTGETVLLARFDGSLAAEKAWVGYLRHAGLNQMSGEGDSQRGYVVTRPVGDRVYALHLGNLLGVWTAPNDAMIRRRMMAGGFAVPRRAPLASSPEPGVPGGEAGRLTPLPSGESRGWSVPVLVGVLSVYLVVVILFFFKGAAWAGTVAPRAGAVRVEGLELARRLESINTLEVPFQLEPGARPGEYVATWRYGDARWADLGGVHRLSRTHRIRFRLDEAAGVVRAVDEAARWDASVGPGGGSLQWKSGLGIQFFEQRVERVLGLQFDAQGKPVANASYRYSFKLAEMKEPLVRMVTEAGWGWRPTVWDGPEWLGWLTH